MFEYSRAVHYYETDKMGVVHHSNFIRWCEEARTAYFDELGMPYERTEDGGVYCPVTGMSFRLRHFARFGDRFTVRVSMTKYTGVRFEVRYEIVNQDGTLLFEGESGHAFISASTYRPTPLRRTAMAHIDECMRQSVEK